jgi:hypothetical protein
MNESVEDDKDSAVSHDAPAFFHVRICTRVKRSTRGVHK